MNYELISKGSVKGKFRSLFEEYTRRIHAEEKSFRTWPAVEKHLQGKSYVLLSEKGVVMSSEDFSQFIKKQSENGVLRFVFGDEQGFPKSILDKASFVLSLSEMTLPHDLSKIFLVEQLYRAECILKNKKYHR